MPVLSPVSRSIAYENTTARMVGGFLLHHSVVPQAWLVRGSELHHVATSALCSTILQSLRLGWLGALNSTTSNLQSLRSGALSSTCTHQPRWSGALSSTNLQPSALSSTCTRQPRWSGALDSTNLRPSGRGLSAPPALVSTDGQGLSAPPALVSTDGQWLSAPPFCGPQVVGSQLHLHSSAQMVRGSQLHLHSSAQMVNGSLLHHSVVLRSWALSSTCTRQHRWSGALCSTILWSLRLGLSGL